VTEPNIPPHGSAASARYRVAVGSRTLTIVVIEREGGLAVRVDDGVARPVAVRRPRDDELHAILLGDRAFAALVEGREGAYRVVLDGEPVEVSVQDERAARLASAAASGRRSLLETSVNAPMPGLVVAVNVEPGQAVKKGASLVVLQAMKMENDLTAREDATVKDVSVSPGQTVDQGQPLVTLE
jgi:biotin carboxyl carrier protein